MITASQYDSIHTNATTSEQSLAVNVNTIILIANDEVYGGNDLYISLENPIEDDENYLILKAGESFKNLKLKTNKIYFKSSDGTVPFRFFGTKG